MSYTLPPISLTAGQMTPISLPGNLGTVSYVKITNASPYLISLTNLLSGQDYLEPGECNVWAVPGLTTAIQANPQTFLVTPTVIPVAFLVVTWFGQGETPQGSYPVNFNLLQYIGNNVSANTPANIFEQDLFTPFVYYGLTPTKDGVIPNQLDITTGVAFVRQSDSSLLRVVQVATTFATVTPSVVYYLDLNPDATWSWGTAHSSQPNYLSIAQVTTDGSGNISAVTDVRPLNATLLPSITGATLLGGATKGVSLSGYISVLNTLDVTGGILARAGLGQVGSQATAGAFGVPVIVAQALNTHVTITTQQTIIAWVPNVTGLYRASLSFYMGGTSPATITATLSWTSGNNAGNSPAVFLQSGTTVLNAASITTGEHGSENITFYAAGGSLITMNYTNATPTPNDHVNAIIERLS